MADTADAARTGGAPEHVGEETAVRLIGARSSSLVVGVGAAKGVSVDEVFELVEGVLAEVGLDSVDCVVALATLDTKAAEPGIVGAAERLGVPVLVYSAEELAEVPVPNPSDASLTAVGTPSVAEAAALAGGGELLVPKRKSKGADGAPGRVTCAVVRRPVRAPWRRGAWAT